MAIAPDDALGLDEAAAAIENGWTLPARWYADPEVYRLENERIFMRNWTLLCPESKLASAGDHVVGHAGLVPVVVTRDEDGQLHGFVNVCRHRAHPVALKDGCRKLLQCRYHGWTYTLDGRLQNAPRATREMQFDRDELSLVPIAVDTWRGLRVRQPGRGRAAPAATSIPRSSRSRSSGAWASRTGTSAATGSTTSRPTGRSTSRTRPSATTARRCTRRASATPS